MLAKKEMNSNVFTGFMMAMSNNNLSLSLSGGDDFDDEEEDGGGIRRGRSMGHPIGFSFSMSVCMEGREANSAGKQRPLGKPT